MSRQMPAASKGWKTAAKILLTAILSLAVVWTLDIRRLLFAVKSMDGRFLAAGIVLSLAFVSLRIMKWRILTRHNGLDAPVLSIARWALFALSLGVISPARAGEAVSILAFEQKDRLPAATLYLVDRICELSLVLLCAVPGCLYFSEKIGPLVAGAMGLAAIATALIVGSQSVRSRVRTLNFLRRVPRLSGVLFGEFSAPPSYWLVSVLNYVFAYALIVAFILGMQSNLNWNFILLLPIVTLSNLISVTVGGLGVREGLAAALLPSADVLPEVAAMSFFLSFVFTRLFPGALGLAWQSISPSKSRIVATNDV